MLIILDLDGTIIDSQKEHLTSFQIGIRRVLGEYKKEWSEFITSKFGVPRHEILRELFPKLEEEKIDKIAYYAQDIVVNELIDKIKLLPTVKDFLEKNYKKHTLALATSSTTLFQEKIFKLLKLDKYFKVLVRREDVTKAKPDPELLNKTISLAKARKEDSVYIGDSIFDYLCAKSARVRFIGVLQASVFRKEFKTVKAYTVKDFSEIKF